MRIAALAYSLIEATDLAAWRRFAEGVAGFSAHPHPGGLALRMDERAGRLFVVPGSTDRYAASGWEISTEAHFTAAKAELAGHGVAVHQGSRDEIALRHVLDMVWFRDPSGNRHELALGWLFHYATGVAFATLLVAVAGAGWVCSPTPAPAVAVGLATVAAPWLVMQPAMGAGIASRRTPTPGRNRARSLVNHFVFGLGLYLAATLAAALPVFFSQC